MPATKPQVERFIQHFKEIAEEYINQGRPATRVAKVLNEEGHTTMYGKPWNARQVRTWMKRI